MAYFMDDSDGNGSYIPTPVGGEDGQFSPNLLSYIVNGTTGTVTYLPAVPDTINRSVSSNFEGVEILGRSSPIQNYTNTSAQQITVDFKVSQDLLKEPLVDFVNRLYALAYPEYANNVKPPVCYVRIGNIKFRGICKNVDVDWMKPYKEGAFTIAQINLSFETSSLWAPSASQVEKGEF